MYRMGKSVNPKRVPLWNIKDMSEKFKMKPNQLSNYLNRGVHVNAPEPVFDNRGKTQRNKPLYDVKIVEEYVRKNGWLI